MADSNNTRQWPIDNFHLIMYTLAYFSFIFFLFFIQLSIKS